MDLDREPCTPGQSLRCDLQLRDEEEAADKTKVTLVRDMMIGVGQEETPTVLRAGADGTIRAAAHVVACLDVPPPCGHMERKNVRRVGGSERSALHG